MAFSFALILTLAVFLSGILSFIGKRKQSNHLVFEYAHSFFPILLTIWALRSFVVQPYRVPSGSLEPTVKPGDFIAVSQFAYGLRLPLFHADILKLGKPKRGDIALFRWPVNPRIIFVKRVIGLPGDHIVYRNKVLYINGVKAEQKFIKVTYDYGDGLTPKRVVDEMQENLDGVKHDIYLQPIGGETQDFDVRVPANEYFMMGDNRDDSDDSRTWGFVPNRNLIGRAFGIWFSWNPVEHRVRWSRIGRGIH